MRNAGTDSDYYYIVWESAAEKYVQQQQPLRPGDIPATLQACRNFIRRPLLHWMNMNHERKLHCHELRRTLFSLGISVLHLERSIADIFKKTSEVSQDFVL